MAELCHHSKALYVGGFWGERMAIHSFDDDQRLQRRLAERFPSEEESRRDLAAAVSASAAELIESLAAFLLTCGIRKEEVAAALRGAASETLQRELKLEPNCVDLWTQLSDAISAWWRDPAYLDEAGEPKDIPETGATPSVDALLDAHVQPSLRADAKVLLGRTAAKAVNGKWRLNDSRGFLSVYGSEAVQRLHVSLSGMLSTFVDNQTRRREPPNVKNFDSMAIVHNFPVEMIPEVRARMASRFPLVMHDIDRWLTATATEHHEGPVANVGVTVFMHSSHARTLRDPR